RAVITAADVAPRLEGIALRDMPVLARERVRYIGEKVVAVAATDKDLLEEALSAVEVEYEELPAVFDPLEAVGPEAPVLHPEYASYEGPNKADAQKNIQSVESASKGDIERGFAESDEIFENTFRTQPVHQGFIEPRAGVVEIDGEGRVSVWHCHQAPFNLRGWLAGHTGLAEEKVVVHSVATGGSFGGKESFHDVICIYYLARASGKPVKFVSSYSEELLDGEPRHGTVITVRTGVKRDGRLWAWDGRIYYNGGAYAARTPRNGLNGTYQLAGSYRTPHIKIEGKIVYTNQVPSGYFRAPGEVSTLFAVESQVDMIAEALKMDPCEFRLLNAIKEGDSKATGKILRDTRSRDVLERIDSIRQKLKPKVPRGVDRSRILVGRGMSFGDRHIGLGECNADLYLEPDGSLRLATSVRDVGVGAHTMHRQIAAELVGVEPERVAIDVQGTDTGPYDDGVRAQRGVYIEGHAVSRAAEALVELLVKRAAGIWKVENDAVKWGKGGALLKGSKGKFLSLSDLAGATNAEPLCGRGHFKSEYPDFHCFQAMNADVEVDTETGQVRVQGIHFAVDVTRVINPITHRGQMEGAVTQGLGFTMMENMQFDQGRVMTLSLGDYKIPTVRDVPDFVVSLVQADEGPGPFQAKAIAEVGIGITAPAIVNAVYNATGVRIRDLPITPEKILKGLQEK
ncbi:MAG TPA: xanthine dehydrogenase family protein molybdopterin-binding subunit, partial [Candidatus Binatia bacterium]